MSAIDLSVSPPVSLSSRCLPALRAATSLLGLALLVGCSSNATDDGQAGAAPGTAGAASSGSGGTAGAITSGSAGTTAAAGSGGTGPVGGGGSGGAPVAGASGTAGVGGAAGGASAPSWGVQPLTAQQTCVAPPTRNEIATLLSKTGCTDPLDPKKPAATLIPYDVASPLWSDRAEKERFFAVPNGKTITVKDCQRDASACMPQALNYYQDEGDWDFPDGTVFVKNFGFEGRLIETRLLVRKDAFTWWGYSYAWRADGSDADLLESNTDGHLREIQTPSGTQTWHFPSRSQCLVCHTETSGRSLGPETSQLNLDYVYPNGVKGNQIAQMIHAGLFAAGAEPRLLPVYPDPGDTTKPVEARARSYLHANCATCHRPGAEAATAIDLRFETPLPQTKLCNEAPEKGDLGVAGALRLVPGSPEKSLLSLRLHTLDTMVRMPRIGTLVVDDVGVGAVDAWIEGLTACP